MGYFEARISNIVPVLKSDTTKPWTQLKHAETINLATDVTSRHLYVHNFVQEYVMILGCDA